MPDFLRLIDPAHRELWSRIQTTLADGVSCFRMDCVERRGGSNIEGRGLFATRDIEATELLAIKGGRIVSEEAVCQMTTDGILHGSQQQLGENMFLVGLSSEEEDLNLVGYNHSCDPNAVVILPPDVEKEQVSLLMADRDITEGEEITVDYSVSNISNTHRFFCNCGSPECRRIIQPFTDYLAPHFQERHKGKFPSYIQARIDDIGSMPDEERDRMLFAAQGIRVMGAIVVLADQVMEELKTRKFLQAKELSEGLLMFSNWYVETYSPDPIEGLDYSNKENLRRSVREKIALVIADVRLKDQEFRGYRS